jgi:glycosyltransferase involved in cell wall biosynthesis
VPTLDGAEFVGHALRSVERESDPGIHCIVVDGGSKDETVSLVKTFANRIPLTLLERPDSSGWVWSTNLALGLADAPHCSLLHQDDSWLPGRAAAMKRIVASDPELSLVAHSVRYVDQGGRDVGRLSCPWKPLPFRLEAREARRHLIVQNFISTPGAVFRTDVARKRGGLDELLWYTADWDFWLKLAEAGPVGYLPRDLANFRLHWGSQTARGSADHLGFREQLEIVLDRHIDQTVPRAVRMAAQLSVQVNAALAQERHGRKGNWPAIAGQALGAGPRAWSVFLGDSRIAPRVLSRIRAERRAGTGLIASLFRRYQPLRFVVVGSMNTLFGYALYAGLIFLGAGVGRASIVSLIGSILVGFVAQGKIVFLGFGRWSFLKFLVVWTLLYGVYLGFVFAAESIGINNYVGGALAALVIAALSYVLQSTYVFPPSRGGHSDGS